MIIPLRNVSDHAVPWFETSYDYLCFMHQAQEKKYMPKVTNRNTRARCETCPKLPIKISGRRHWHLSVVFSFSPGHVPHHTLVSILLTLKRQVFAWNLRYDTLSITEQNEVIALLSLLLTSEHITPSSSVSTVDFEHLFPGFDLLFFQSLLKLDESKFHLFIDACTAPCLFLPKFIQK